MKNASFKERYGWLRLPFFAVVLAFCLNMFVIVNAHIPSESMMPTVSKGSLVLGNRLAYVSGSPKRGDIIIFRHPEFGKKLLIKRVVAIGGDTFAVDNGRVTVNGVTVEEDYTDGVNISSFEETAVPKGYVIVLGDNRDNSNDSRFWNCPFVNEDDIVAKAFLEYYPKFKKLG